MKKVLCLLVVFTVVFSSVLSGFSVSQSEKDQIVKAINGYVEKLKSYNSKTEQNYFKQ